MNARILSSADVRRLMADPSPEHRIDLADKVTSDFNAGKLSDSERRLIHDVFNILVRDAEVRVREVLAANLKSNAGLPHDVAQVMARDVESVALPILQFSDVLTDDDLIQIVGELNPAKQVAIARRSTVSDAVSSAMVEKGTETAVAALVANTSAHITEKSLNRAIDRFSDSDLVQTNLVHRPKLPVKVTERLLAFVAANLKAELVKRQDMPTDLATEVVMQAREMAVVRLSSGSSEHELHELVHGLNENSRLTVSLIMRAMCMGDLRFFEAALAELSGLTSANASKLIYDSNPRSFKAIYAKAKLPQAQFAACRAAIDLANEIQYDGGAGDRQRFCRRMIESVLSQHGELGVNFDPEDLDYLLKKLQASSAASLPLA